MTHLRLLLQWAYPPTALAPLPDRDHRWARHRPEL